MKIAIIGYGKMGKEIEAAAISRNHKVEVIVDIIERKNVTIDELKKCDVAFEFTTPQSAYDNIMLCFDADIPIVVGTTGWLDKLDEIKNYCIENNKTMIFSSNFSIGMNIFFAINRKLASIMSEFLEYDIAITEIHHKNKLDAPSGTAIKLANDIIINHQTKEKWVTSKPAKKDEILIESIREGDIVGIHKVNYFSEIDEISLMHNAKNRKGFAIGAVIAAEWVVNKKGFYTMNDLLNLNI